MNKIKLYIQETYDELVNNVTWPTWKDLQLHVVIVLIGTVIFSLLVYIMDLGIGKGLTEMYKAFVK